MNCEPETVIRYFRVDRSDLVYLKFVLEAYEGMATMSTVNRQSGIVRISCGEWAATDVGTLLDSLCQEISMKQENNIA